MKLPSYWFQSGYIYYTLGKESAANSQKGCVSFSRFGAGFQSCWVCLRWCQLHSLANTLVHRWIPKSPAWEGLNGRWQKNTSWMGVLGEVLEDQGLVTVMLSRTSNEPSKHQNSFSSSCTASFLLHRPLPTPLGWREGSKAATCGTELVPTWRIIPLRKVVRHPHLSAIFADHLEGEQSQLGDLGSPWLLITDWIGWCSKKIQLGNLT